MSRPEPLTPEAIVGLLAEDDRLRVVAALVLGAGTLDDVARVTGMGTRRAALAVERLAGGGLVEPGEKGGLRLAAGRFKDAARAAARSRAAERPPEEFDAPPQAAAVLRRFVRDGRLVSIPSPHGKRLVVLDWLARRFEPGRVYPERDVNLVLGLVHPDTAALRRHLVDEGLLERRAGLYWRAGGTVDTG